MRASPRLQYVAQLDSSTGMYPDGNIRRLYERSVNRECRYICPTVRVGKQDWWQDMVGAYIEDGRRARRTGTTSG